MESAAFASCVREMQDADGVEACPACGCTEWEWLDCDECRLTIGECGEQVCAACGSDW